MYTKEYEIKFYEVDYKNRLKETVLLNFLQDIASVHAEKNGFGYSFISKKNLAWFLMKYHLKVFKWPENMEKVIIKTWPRAIIRLSCLRDFEIYSPEMEKIAVVSSSWALTDVVEKKIAVPSEHLTTYNSTDQKALETNFPKIPMIQNIMTEKIYEVKYDDIDINQHVNNANYLGWALDTLDFDFRANNKVEEMEIQYKKELKYGSEVKAATEINQETKTTIHNLKNIETDDILCIIRIKWH